jgi:hypothetical protein
MRHESEDEISLTTEVAEPWYRRIAKKVINHFVTNRREYERFFVIGGWILLGIAMTAGAGILIYVFAYMLIHYY